MLWLRKQIVSGPPQAHATRSVRILVRSVHSSAPTSNPAAKAHLETLSNRKRWIQLNFAPFSDGPLCIGAAHL